MNLKLFKEKYKQIEQNEDSLNKHIQTIINLEKFSNKDIIHTDLEDIKRYVEYLIKNKQNTYYNLVHIARYYSYIGKSELYIHMTKYFNSIGVLENIIDRVGKYDSKENKDELISSITLPEFGTDSTNLPRYTKDFMDKLNKHLPKSKCNKILAGNNHKIPKESFIKEKEIYDTSKSLKEYLKEKHSRKIKELEHYYTNNLVWFEQIITKEAIEYVLNNQEILSGVLEDGKLYITKIPYNINKFLSEKDDTLKRYYACHCSFVRENILSNKEDLPKEWCYCSAGFAKAPYEVIFNQELEVKLLQTPLDGDYVCRFEIDLSDIDYKQ